MLTEQYGPWTVLIDYRDLLLQWLQRETQNQNAMKPEIKLMKTGSMNIL